MSERNQFLDAEVRSGLPISREMKSIWKAELDILEKFIAICQRHGLNYSLAGGNLIGAFRHKGFIPWDDDIDVDMVREDYDKFLSVAQAELPEGYFLQTSKTDHGRVVNFAQIRNSNMACIDPHWTDLGVVFNSGVGIDIFPIDGVPKGRFRYLFTKWTVRIVQSLHYNSQIRKNFGLKGFLRRYAAKTICALVGYDNLYELREWALRRNKFSDCEMCGEFSYAISMRNPKLIWPTKCYDHYLDVQYEYLTVKVAAGYDEMLTCQYGDWRKPVKGAGDHGELYFDLEQDYKTVLIEKFGYEAEWFK